MPTKIHPSILTNGITDVEPFREWGQHLATARDEKGRDAKLTTAQIRKFFGEVKKIQADFENKKGEIILLTPKLAYAVGRDKGKIGLKSLYDLLTPLIAEINKDKARFRVFVQVFEAIVAYHKEFVKE
ncbi:MAG: type III-A CRISPR-associated protein Csm2 [Bacteroidales bacterium]|nr:type III-A CRISPR-associated protein Csm2 [Bacteroidales bacterium]